MTHLLQKLKDKFTHNQNTPVSHLGFGGAVLSGEEGGYGFGPLTDSESSKLLDLSFAKGIWLYDSAPVYGFGKSEERLGKHFKSNREKVCLISKGGVTWHSNKRIDMSNDPKIIQTMLDNSLKSFASDYIDIYMIHWPDPKVDIRRSLEVLAKAQIQGKILHIGLCNTNLSELEKSKEIVEVELVQSQFNIWATESDQIFLNKLHEMGISFMSWGTLDKGILSGRVDSKRTFHKTDCRFHAPWWKKEKKEWKYQTVEKIKQELLSSFFPGVAENEALISSALSYNLQSQVDMLLVGAKSEGQLSSLLYSLNLATNLAQHSLDSFKEEVKKLVKLGRSS